MPNQLPLLLADLMVGARLLGGLPAFFRRPLTPEQAREIVRQRLERRSSDFLMLVRRTVYEHSASPYRAILRAIGCEFGDLEHLVGRDGVEGALHSLLKRGLYLTVDEFRGGRPVIRGSLNLWVDPTQLHNPLTSSHVRGTSGGSRGARRTVPYDLACFWDRAVNTCLTLVAQGGEHWVKAVWGVPGGSMGNYLRFSPFGEPPARWFVQVAPTAPGLQARYRWSARVLRWGAAIAGARVPAPQYVPLENPLPIAHWLVEVLRSGRRPHIEMFTSSAVRLAQVASQAGLNLDGAHFLTIGEPTTAARLATIRQSGAHAYPDYGSSEAGGPVGNGCFAPEAPDDVHLYQDLHALIQPGAAATVSGLPPRALLVTSLRASSPLILLNVSMGDQAEISQRTCGCPLEPLGWTTHLHNIRSYEKLTAAGMTFLDADVVQILEETLPACFGGGPGDYQLLEDEAEDGQPRLRLLVHPALGSLDDRAVIDAFLDAVGSGSGAERVMGLVWRDAQVLQIERRAPVATAGGKIQHLHVERPRQRV